MPTKEEEQTARDAARYRWLRAKARTGTGEPFIARSHLSGFSAWALDDADRVIDAAMRDEVKDAA